MIFSLSGMDRFSKSTAHQEGEEQRERLKQANEEENQSYLISKQRTILSDRALKLDENNTEINACQHALFYKDTGMQSVKDSSIMLDENKVLNDSDTIQFFHDSSSSHVPGNFYGTRVKLVQEIPTGDNQQKKISFASNVKEEKINNSSFLQVPSVKARKKTPQTLLEQYNRQLKGTLTDIEIQEDDINQEDAEASTKQAIIHEKTYDQIKKIFEKMIALIEDNPELHTKDVEKLLDINAAVIINEAYLTVDIKRVNPIKLDKKTISIPIPFRILSSEMISPADRAAEHTIIEAEASIENLEELYQKVNTLTTYQHEGIGVLAEPAAGDEKQGVDDAQQWSVYGNTRVASTDATQLVAPAVGLCKKSIMSEDTLDMSPVLERSKKAILLAQNINNLLTSQILAESHELSEDSNIDKASPFEQALSSLEATDEESKQLEISLDQIKKKIDLDLFFHLKHEVLRGGPRNSGQ